MTGGEEWVRRGIARKQADVGQGRKGGERGRERGGEMEVRERR